MRNGSGTMLPVTNSWNPQVNGVNATGPDFNQLYFDLLNALTQSLSADGQTPVTGNIQMGNNKLTGLAAGSGTGQSLRWEQLFDQGVETDVASASTTDIGIHNTNFIRITGTTGITSFGTNYRGPRFIRFAAALTLTNSATLVLPGGADITTDAGATAIAYPIGNPSAGWVVAAYRSGNSTVNPPISKIFPIAASVATNILTATLAPCSFDFRSATLGNGAPNTRVVPSTLTLTVPATATLGTTNGVISRLILVAIDNAGTVELAVINRTDNSLLDENALISTTAIGVGSSTANVFYSTTARSNVPYRVIGYVESNQATAGLWSTAPSTVQGAGGEALVYLGVPYVAPITSIPVRQTVLSGPVLSSGLSNFGGATGSTAVTTSATLIATAANGFTALMGAVNRVGTINNPSWTGLNTNGTMYLYLDIAADSTCTTGSTALSPTYRAAGSDVVTSGQFTFNYKEMVGKVGNGATAAQVYRVFVGEVSVAGGVVTAIRWYMLNGQYYRLDAANSVGGNTYSHLLGLEPLIYSANLFNYTADVGYSNGDRVPVSDFGISTDRGKVCNIWASQTSIGVVYVSTGVAIFNRGTGVYTTINNANWGTEYIANRGW